MKRLISSSLVVVASTVVAGAEMSDFFFIPEDVPDQRVRFRAKFGFNVDVDFQDTGSVLPAHPAGRYLDGHVLPDVNGAGGDGLTWNWGYQNDTQYDAGADTLTYSAIDSSDSFAGSRSESDDPLPGFELSYIQTLGTIGRVAWGIELAGGYTQISAGFDRSLMSNISLRNDVFSLGGVIPPSAPYNGSFDGPGPVIPLAPSGTSMVTGTSTVMESQDYKARLVGFRLGPVFDIPIYRGLSSTVGVGLAYTYAEGRYSYTASATLPDGSAYSETYKSEENERLVGAYLDAALNYQFTQTFGANLGVQYQYLEDLDQTVGNRKATLNLGSTVFLTAGVTLAF